MIAGASSGVGKTTITMGAIAALKRQGLHVQPFKAGPDYIDPTYHALAAGRPCRNIDTWMVPPERALALFQNAAREADIAIIEGVMGLFDGFSYETEAGSSAEIAKLIDAPVLLILDVGKVARSVGAIAIGYANFDPGLNLAGFILNRCGSESHFQGAKLAVEQAAGLPVLGWLPKDAGLHIPERHLGLVPTNERGELTDFINHTADLIEQHFDLTRILTLAAQPNPAAIIKPEAAPPSPNHPTRQNPGSHSPQPTAQIQNPKSHIAVARDAAFSFYYEDNLDLLREANAAITFFSPQTDTDLPQGINGIYLGGGFPEMFAAQLAANTMLKEAIRRAHAANMPIYAECGGFMYLTEAIIDLEGLSHPMVGLIPGATRMERRLMSLGYRIVESPTGNFLLPQGFTSRGHEFHWSTWDADHTSQWPPSSPAWHIRPRHGSDDFKPSGYAQGQLIASYVHLHFAHDLQLARNFIQACQRWEADHAA